MMEAKKKKGGGSALGFMLFICYKSLGVYFQAESLRSLVSTRTILESYLRGMKWFRLVRAACSHIFPLLNCSLPGLQHYVLEIIHICDERRESLSESLGFGVVECFTDNYFCCLRHTTLYLLFSISLLKKFLQFYHSNPGFKKYATKVHKTTVPGPCPTLSITVLLFYLPFCGYNSYAKF